MDKSWHVTFGSQSNRCVKIKPATHFSEMKKGQQVITSQRDSNLGFAEIDFPKLQPFELTITDPLDSTFFFFFCSLSYFEKTSSYATSFFSKLNYHGSHFGLSRVSSFSGKVWREFVFIFKSFSCDSEFLATRNLKEDFLFEDLMQHWCCAPVFKFLV